MIAREFDSISKNDIDALVASGEPERRTIEYKQALPSGNDEGTREFLADASSFANASGGDLIYGIRDKKDAANKPTGIPEAVDGLANINADAEKLRLTNMLRDGIDPRIPGVQIKHIDGFQSGPVIILRIPKSWSAPHMVKFRGSSRFYSRTSAGKYPMDVREIRSAFIASESLAEKIASFRSERVSRILVGETPVPLGALPKIVLHLLPIRAFSEPEWINLNEIQKNWDINIRPMGSPTQWSPACFNFRGLYCYGGASGMKPIRGHIQLFRNGAFEAVCVGLTSDKLLSGRALEQELMREGPKYIKLLDRLDVGPMFVALTIVSTKGLTIVETLNVSYPFELSSTSPIEDDVLLAPETLNDEKGGDIRKLLRPALDSIWQASGWPGSRGYDEDGNWGYGPTM